MKVLGLPLVEEFARRHADALGQLSAWIQEAREAKWTTPADVKRRYSTASFVGANQVVFNIKGKHVRLLVTINYKNQIVRMGQCQS
jgi:mRNA interferase HigB